MQTPVRTEFQEMAASPAVEAMIADHVKKLEQLYGRITACRIVVKGPGNRQKTGGQYDIHIRLALPDGREVDIGRTPKEDERHSDLLFAINDAFKRAGRRLQDKARRMAGMVKSHEGQPVGTVARLDPAGEFGFLRSSDGDEIYFHRNSVLDGAFSELAVGSRVVFTDELGEKGVQATTVKLLEKHGLRA
ncbi:DNA-binding protein [Afipia sp. Root123D2]|uniref:HPF/RaiA family ribosome-associated protein n=1 Tax=Afipia sp. Root123D2 TaxID=1736436 RepID=UPI0006F33DDF|nr:HPF/RaiA family ribosome-associated protein [Afipia sp. Root123D2]KQW20955.1 DNA-binding protein [Afipia sp. Root123D2]